MDAVTAPQENRKPGANPGRYRHCMRGGSLFGESRSLEKSEKAIENRRSASQENCLNEVKTLGSASTEPVVFCCGKTAAATLFVGLLQLFCCDRLRVDSPFCTDCPDGHSPQTN